MPTPAAQDPITLRPERLVAGGDALARLDDGRVAFVTGALPDEEVEVVVDVDRSDFVRAALTEVVDPSPDRVVPTCPFRRDGCGGCGWMHLAPHAQLDAKIEIVTESLRRIGRFDASEVARLVRSGGAVDPYGYRTSIRLVGTPGRGVGYREERSDRVVPIDHCQIAHENLSRIIREVEVAPGVELSLRTSVATDAVTARWTRPEDRRRRGERRRTNVAAGESVKGLPGDVHIGDRAFLVERVSGVDLRVSAPSFFQSGVDAAEMLVDAVERAAPELVGAGHAVDAYAGVGLFAATAMRHARHVTVVESSRSSCFDAKENLRHRSGSGDRSVAIARTDVARWEPDSANGAVDVVVADPGRPGLAKPGTGAIERTAAPVVVLVSCDPVSLARDARLLTEIGYGVDDVEVLDIFPQTPHVECVTRFTRRGD
ncbi:class I SAM-dependent RNA methyltransferase [Ilumatobacter sp.]|uniref:class I SAM-dependent RNA methyltransferase n=1 Tax=Ilumatobacter sp. TaxID=1967498 RepID=UPI003B5294C3